LYRLSAHPSTRLKRICLGIGQSELLFLEPCSLGQFASTRRFLCCGDFP
jgi:hypothetical protein